MFNILQHNLQGRGSDHAQFFRGENRFREINLLKVVQLITDRAGLEFSTTTKARVLNIHIMSES